MKDSGSTVGIANSTSMIHIATVHWLDDTWVDIQLAYFEKYLESDTFRVYAFLNGINTEIYRRRMHYISTEPIQPHATKLNLLAEEISKQAEPDDIIFFIDGDAIPVGDIESFVKEKLKQFDLVAIQRLENEGDPQPHPSFCATTVRFWNEIGGDWEQGPTWTTSDGIVRSDVGAVLWEKLKKQEIDWLPMHRSNTLDLHPLWFGVYEGLIYHHGAAFRTPYCMIDIKNARQSRWKRYLMDIADSKMGAIRQGWVQNAIYSFVMKRQIRKVQGHSSRILGEIRHDSAFTQQFDKT